MGRKSAAKAQRRASDGDGQRSTQLDLLQIATQIVGEFFGNSANCADAAALLMETALRLDYQLQLQPVSVRGWHKSTGQQFVMGPRATSTLTEEERRSLTDLRGEGKDNGHLVLTLDEPALVLDPNIRQLGRYGIAVPSIMLRVETTRPSTGRWDVQFGDLLLRYFVDDNKALLPRYEAARAESSEAAALVARRLRAGASMASICAELQRVYNYKSLHR